MCIKNCNNNCRTNLFLCSNVDFIIENRQNAHKETQYEIALEIDMFQIACVDKQMLDCINK